MDEPKESLENYIIKKDFFKLIMPYFRNEKKEEIIPVDRRSFYREEVNRKTFRKWKIDPKDIADFYLLSEFIQSTGSSHPEDSKNVAVLQARGRIGEIGRKLTVALMHEQFEELGRFGPIKGGTVPAELKAKLPDQNAALNNYSETAAIIYQMENMGQLAFDQVYTENRDKMLTTLQYISANQTPKWKNIAQWMIALLDKDNIRQLPHPFGKFDQTLIIDRLINSVHYNGAISTRVTNNFPEAALVLTAHGLVGGAQLLLQHSRLINSGGDLANLIRQKVTALTVDPGKISFQLVEAIQSNRIPPIFQDGLLLESDDSSVRDAISQKQGGKRSYANSSTAIIEASLHDHNKLE